jgi:putative transposase
VAAFIVSQREGHGVPYAVCCRALGVSPSWLYKWRTGELPPSARRRERLYAEVAALSAAREGKGGEPRVTAALREAGWVVSRKAVAASMARQGLLARPGRRGRRGTTRKGKARWRAEDLVRREFAAAGISRRWYGDGTEIETGEGGGCAAPQSAMRCAPGAGGVPRRGYGAAPPASRVLAHRPAGDGPAGRP